MRRLRRATAVGDKQKGVEGVRGDEGGQRDSKVDKKRFGIFLGTYEGGTVLHGFNQLRVGAMGILYDAGIV